MPEICYNAKGFPYYYLGEDGTYAYTLIENVYAYVIVTGEIIASGRQAWADVGTEENREATGE